MYPERAVVLINASGERRPYLAPYVASLNSFEKMPVIVAGTNLNLKSRDIFYSAVQKTRIETGEDLKLHFSFSCTSASECAKFLQYLLKKAKIDASAEDIALAGEWLQGYFQCFLLIFPGRARWATSFVRELLEGSPKKSFFDALLSHVNKTAANGATDPSGLQFWVHRFMQHHQNNPNRNYLLTRLLAAYSRREATALNDKYPQDYIGAGLAFLKEIPGQGGGEAKFRWICTEVRL
jgi:hypothetical protein